MSDGPYATDNLLERAHNPYGMTDMNVGELLPLLAAEIERLNTLIDEAGKPFLALDPGLQWEGGIDDAMKAACMEIMALRTNGVADFAAFLNAIESDPTPREGDER